MVDDNPNNVYIFKKNHNRKKPNKKNQNRKKSNKRKEDNNTTLYKELRLKRRLFIKKR